MDVPVGIQEHTVGLQPFVRSETVKRDFVPILPSQTAALPDVPSSNSSSSVRTVVETTVPVDTPSNVTVSVENVTNVVKSNAPTLSLECNRSDNVCQLRRRHILACIRPFTYLLYTADGIRPVYRTLLLETAQ
jgi:hypothetical protein